MNAIPENIAFAEAFRATFAAVVDGGYSILENVADDTDAEEIREEFDRAISEAANYYGTLSNDAETMGALADIVLDVWTELNEFFVSTTE
jgi:hypothetical protein